jgi:hypothetical protein
MQRLASGAAVALALVSFGTVAGCQGCARDASQGQTSPALATSEADLARRTAAVTLRERAVELREKSVTEREAKLQEALVTAVPITPVVSPALAQKARATQTVHTEQEAEVGHRRVQNEMEAKGLLAADLPADAARLDDQIYAAMRAGEYDRAFDLTDQLGRAVAAVQVDQAFLDSKMRRVAALRSRKQLAAQAASEIDTLLQEVTSLAADGQYGTANRRVNRIAAILQ